MSKVILPEAIKVYANEGAAGVVIEVMAGERPFRFLLGATLAVRVAEAIITASDRAEGTEFVTRNGGALN